MIDDDPPNHLDCNRVVAMNDPVPGICYFPGIGKIKGWVCFQYPVNCFANDLQVTFHSPPGFQIILKLGENLRLPLKISLNFFNGLKNVIKPGINFRIHKPVF
jgi:hypothetical protein